jgi:cytidylate kinase
VLRDHPTALHVRLDAPRKQRLARMLEWEHTTEDAAGRLMDSTDRAWLSYVRYFYKADARDPSLYHLLMNSVVLSLEACTELIVTAALDRAAGAAR